MKRLPLTLPQLGSTYPFKIDGRSELFTVDRIDLAQDLMYLESCERTFERAMFINDVVRMVRPNDAAAWLPVLREHYTMSDEGRAALIAEANAPRTVAEDLAWVDSLECIERGPYTPMGPVCPNGEDLARAFPQVPNDDLSRDLYATIGDPVPPLVWPRQGSEQSPTHSETSSLQPTAHTFKVGDRVVFSQRAGAECDHDCAPPLGWDSPAAVEALALENACSETTKEPDAAHVANDEIIKPRTFKAGDRVIVARKVERDSSDHWCFWPKFKEVLGAGGVVAHVGRYGAFMSVDVDGCGLCHFSPEALDLVTDAAPAVAPRDFKAGDKVRVARKVTTDSKGRRCDWDERFMDATVGTVQTISHVESHGSNDSIPVRLESGYWYSPEALDLIEE